MKIYLASAWTDKERMRSVRNHLESIGHTITSRWLDAMDDDDPALSAEHDFNDIFFSDALVSFHDRPSTKGGRHVEFGIALTLGKRIISVGPVEHVFSELPVVEHVDSVFNLYRHLLEVA